MRPLSLTLPMLILGPVLARAAPPDAEALEAAMDKAHREALVCLSDAAGSDSPGGELVVRVLVDPRGALVQPEVTRTSIRDGEVVQCVLAAIARQRVPREGSGYLPIQRTMVVWAPPAGAAPVKVQRAQKLVGDALAELGTCLEALPDTPARLDVDFLVGERRVHPLSADLPSEQARCVSQALSGARLPGVGAVRAKIERGPDGDWSIDHIGSVSDGQSEARTLERGRL